MRDNAPRVLRRLPWSSNTACGTVERRYNRGTEDITFKTEPQKRRRGHLCLTLFTGAHHQRWGCCLGSSRCDVRPAISHQIGPQDALVVIPSSSALPDTTLADACVPCLIVLSSNDHVHLQQGKKGTPSSKFLRVISQSRYLEDAICEPPKNLAERYPLKSIISFPAASAASIRNSFPRTSFVFGTAHRENYS